jgi:N-methylhydantoinase B
MIRLPPNINKRLKKGDILIAEFSGGGGYGPPSQRKREYVIRDIEEGEISKTKAQTVYDLKQPKAELQTTS